MFEEEETDKNAEKNGGKISRLCRTRMSFLSHCKTPSISVAE